MKRRFDIQAVSTNGHTANISILVTTDGTFSRDEAAAKARDVADSVVKALHDWYRPTRIKLK
jgi:hypothetical protein